VSAETRILARRFPPRFVWGVATSAYQIEGAAHEDGRGDSIWDEFCRRPGAIKDGSNGDRACDHYHRVDEDVSLIAGLGVHAYRFSIAWPRVQPRGEGAWNEKGFAFYDRLIDRLLERGIAPHLTLYHWDLPQALQEKGGWLSRDTTLRFVEYAVEVGRRLGDRAASIATHNEPWVVAILGHEAGIFAPGLKSQKVAMQVAHHLLLSHGVALKALRAEDLQGLARGVVNLERHLNNVRNHFGVPCVVALNHFVDDTDAELALLAHKMAHHEVPLVVSRHWSDGGRGAEALAHAVVQVAETMPADFRFVYEDSDTLWQKAEAVAKKIYGASEVTADSKVKAQLQRLQEQGYGHFPVCIAKTAYSFSTDPTRLGAPSGHVLNIREVRLAAGAEFVVLVCGDIMTMPGLPRVPAAETITLNDMGGIEGLF